MEPAASDEVPDESKTANTPCAGGAKRGADGQCPSAVPVPVTAKPKTKPASETPQAAPPASGDINADMQVCQQAAQQAASCCNNPDSCISSQTRQQISTLNALQSSGNTQGLKDYCQQMNSTGNGSRSANEEAANACRTRYMSCASTCNSYAQTYGSSGSQFSDIANQCNGLQARVQAMGSQGLAAAGSAGNGNACNNMTNAAPQSAGGMPNMPNQNGNDQNKNASNDPNDPSGCKNNPTGAQCQRCTANPNDPSCGTAMQKGQSAFSDNNDKPTDKSGFDIPTPTSASHSMFDQAAIPTGQAPKNGTIANNSGGGIPGQGGGGGGAANLGGNGQKKVAGGGSGVSTDILQGNMPGGYTSPGGSAETDGGGGGWGGYGGRMPASASGTGMDLKQFLPGQKKAPAFVGGAYSMQSAEIAGKHGDIFEKITRKFHEKCLQGQLIGCDR